MEKGERETHDFMNVESFSQLPFIRSARPPKEKGSGIRLFGIEFGGKEAVEDSESGETTEMDTSSKETDNNNINNNNNDNNNRRFECHYCCRNFPTSQALGGHQNAHKRERQHAKRAHLQSAMVHSGLTSDNHIYGLVNYRTTNPTFSTTTNYPSWNSHIPSSSGRFYGVGSHHPPNHHQQPINGSPLGLWRIPPASSIHGSSGFHPERSLMHPLPLFSGEELRRNSQIGGSSSEGQFGYENSKSSVQDHVSLDLHL